MIIVLLVILMARWQLFDKSKEKKIFWGCLIGALNLLFILENLLPLTLAEQDYIQAHEAVVVAICLAKISVGVMEELAIPGRHFSIFGTRSYVQCDVSILYGKESFDDAECISNIRDSIQRGKRICHLLRHY